MVDYQEKGGSNEKIRVRPSTPHGEHKHVNRTVAQNGFLVLSDKPKGIQKFPQLLDQHTKFRLSCDAAAQPEHP